MLRYCQEMNESNEQQYKCKIWQMFGGNKTLRQVTDAREIRKDGNINN